MKIDITNQSYAEMMRTTRLLTETLGVQDFSFEVAGPENKVFLRLE